MQKAQAKLLGLFVMGPRRRPTLPHKKSCSTIGAEELNDRVRDGIGCDLFAMTTENYVGCTLVKATNAFDNVNKNNLVSNSDIRYLAERVNGCPWKASRPISTG